MDHCKICNHQLSGNFCSNCGGPVKLKRIDGHYILHEISHVLHFEKGILFTIKELLIRPGLTVREFITENRNRLVKPVIFVIVSSLIYSLLTHFFHLEDGYMNFTETPGADNAAEKSAIGVIFQWMQTHYGYTNVIMGVFIAMWLKLLFRKYHYNPYELLILLCYVMGMVMLLISVIIIFQGLTKLPVLQAAGVVVLLYSSWAIGQFFDQRKIINYLKAFAAYILGMSTFVCVVVVTGLIFDFFKH